MTTPLGDDYGGSDTVSRLTFNMLNRFLHLCHDRNFRPFNELHKLVLDLLEMIEEDGAMDLKS